jgi:hypothetical protein
MQLIAAAVLFLTALLLELCWLGAWATFIYSALFERPYPLPDMLVCAGLAALLVRATATSRLRNIQVLALHGLCSVGFWLFELQRVPALPTPISAALALSTAAFWTSGACHARRTLTHQQVCARFDFGMYWLFALLGMRLLLRGQAQVPQHAELTDALVPCYFVNAVCAIAVSRYRSHSSKRWLRVAGRVSVLFAMLCGLAVLLFSITWISRTYLRQLAETLHASAAAVARPIANAAAEIMLYLMRLAREHPPPVYEPDRTPGSYVISKPVKVFTPEALAVLASNPTRLWVIAGVLLLIVVLAWAWWKRHWLWADQTSAPAHNAFWVLCLRLWQRLLTWLRRATTLRDPEPMRLLHALLVWGRRSGIARESAETPLEYAARLKLRFAAMSDEIDSIVTSHSRYAYALAGCDEQELQRARRALLRLRSPSQWWTRSASWWQARAPKADRV